MTHPPSLQFFRWPVLLAAGALLLAGCGLSEYAGQMSSEAVRAQHWDEETKMLGGPISVPELPKKGDVAQYWEVFLRLPRGVSEDPETQPNSSLAQLYGSLARYPAAANQGQGIQNVYLGVSTDQKDYLAPVCSQFGITEGSESTITVARSLSLLGGPAPKAGEVPMKPEILVKRKVAEGQSLYSVNLYDHAGVQVAVVFQMAKGNGTKADMVIKMSLGTLGEGVEATAFTREYRRTNLKPIKK